MAMDGGAARGSIKGPRIEFAGSRRGWRVTSIRTNRDGEIGKPGIDQEILPKRVPRPCGSDKSARESLAAANTHHRWAER